MIIDWEKYEVNYLITICLNHYGVCARTRVFHYTKSFQLILTQTMYNYTQSQALIYIFRVCTTNKQVNNVSRYKRVTNSTR